MARKKGTNFRQQKGFTLIELMATLVILALIIAIAVPAIGKLVTKSGESADKASIALMERAGEMAYVNDVKTDDANPKKPASITEKDVYMIPTLIESGYLKLDKDSKFNKPENYVKKVNKSGKFIYMGKGSDVADEVGGDGDPSSCSEIRNGEQEVHGDYVVDIKDCGARIIAYNGSDTDLVIPEEFGGVPTVAIGNWFDVDDIDNMEASGVLPDGIAVFMMRGLTSIVIPDTVTEIGALSFAMNNLSALELPSSLERLGAMSFMSTIQMPNHISGTLVIPDTVTRIDYGAFTAQQFTNIVIPDSVTVLGERAFDDNSSLVSLTIGDGLEVIEPYTFDGTGGGLPEKKTTLSLGQNIRIIHEGAFMGMNLHELVIPDSVEVIGGYAFYETRIQKIVLSKHVKEIGDSAFGESYYWDLNHIEVHNPDALIGVDAFHVRPSLVNLVMYGHEGSTLQDYAVKYGAKFELIP